MWLEFEVEFGAIPVNGHGVIYNTVDVEVGGISAQMPPEVIREIVNEEAEEILAERGYALFWTRGFRLVDHDMFWPVSQDSD